MAGRRDRDDGKTGFAVSALILCVRVDSWSASRMAAVIVDPRRRRAACYGREGVEEGEEEAWRKVKREWMGWKEEGMGRRKGWNEEGMGQRKGWEGGRDGEEKGTGRRKGWGGGRDGEEEGIGRRKGWGGGRDREETPRWETCRRETCRRDSGRREGGIVMTGSRDS